MPRSPLQIAGPAALAPAPQALKQAIAGWGNFPTEECFVYRPERIAELDEVVARAPERDLIPRGLGRSYGDAYTHWPRWDASLPAFEWDGDAWYINVVGHGLFGSELYVRARVCRRNVLEALFFTAAGSAVWAMG